MGGSFIYVAICRYMTQLFDNTYYQFPSLVDIAQMSRNNTYFTLILIILIVTVAIIVSWLFIVLIKGYAYYSLFGIFYLIIGFSLIYGVSIIYRTKLLLGLEVPSDLNVIYWLMISSAFIALAIFVIKMVHMFIKPTKKITVTSTTNVVINKK